MWFSVCPFTLHPCVAALLKKTLRTLSFTESSTCWVKGQCEAFTLTLWHTEQENGKGGVMSVSYRKNFSKDRGGERTQCLSWCVDKTDTDSSNWITHKSQINRGFSHRRITVINLHKHYLWYITPHTVTFSTTPHASIYTYVSVNHCCVGSDWSWSTNQPHNER